MELKRMLTPREHQALRDQVDRPPDGFTIEECFAWMHTYRATPWNALALATAVDYKPSPLRIMASLAWHVERLRVTLDNGAERSPSAERTK